MELEKRGKDRQLKSASVYTGDKEVELLEKQLQRDLRDKEEEIDRLRSMIRDKKLELETKKNFR